MNDTQTRSKLIPVLLILCFLPFGKTNAQHSVARKWNEVLLEAIRNDFARPTVHARNLFHTSVAMYDLWAVFDETADPYFLGNLGGDFNCPFDGMPMPTNTQAAQEEAISYACFRLLQHRFVFSPGARESFPIIDSLMAELGYDPAITTVDYSSGSPAALGNYLAQRLIIYGLRDGSNEVMDYANTSYTPFNGLLAPARPGSQDITDPNRWQPLVFDFFVDQAGFEIPGGAPEFLSPEWGKVSPFSLSADDLTIYNRNGEDYFVYHDPGAPAYLQQDGNGSSDDYKWNHSLVSIWSSHLDPTDNVMIDISPASIGNLDIANFPTTLAGLRDFYQLEDGGDPGQGYNLNPYTQQPYSPQIVPRADYARVLAEFWADGPDSETPPGHWFTILNTVNDHPLLEKKFKGQGPVLNDLEWDVKAYFTLGGTMHDAAISAWGIKGWYDYIRPISALRYMADQGQSSDPDLPNYSPAGIPLQDGYIELVSENDSLAGSQGEHIGKIKLYAWRGPDAIDDPTIDVGGVDWILAENWWPYQRPSFVTPPFAGYVSGHSTYSRAAAEVLTLFTGDAYFPGGLGEFIAEKDSFLVFEKGPSTNMVLQWAKYYDASDQCSLSRIWGGIHPPVDDIPGRLIGHEVGRDAFQYAEQFFNQSTTPTNDPLSEMNLKVFPNPAVDMGNQTTIYTNSTIGDNAFWTLTSLQGQELHRGNIASGTSNFLLPTQHVPAGFYLLNVYSGSSKGTAKIIVQ